MKAQTSQVDLRGAQNGHLLGLLVASGFLISLVVVSGQSLWIDEALTASKAKQPTLTGCWQAMVGEKTSDLQMPLYMIYIWAYEKVFGSSEWTLRAANLPWFALGLAAFVTAVSPANHRRVALAFVAALSPFAWYYLNEARPYAMQLGGSLVTFAALHRLSQERWPDHACERSWVTGFCLGLAVLCGSSLLGMIWAAAALAAVTLILPPGRLAALLRSHRAGALVTGGLILLLALYYAWTLKIGARAGRAAVTDWKSAVFTGYELLGFSGLGPGRLEIREGGLGVFLPHAFKLALYGVTVLVLFGAGVRGLWGTSDRKKLVGLALIAVAPALVLMTAGVVLHFRVLGRHFTPLASVVFFLLSTGVVALWSRRGWLAKVMVGGFFVLSLYSGLSLRFAIRHEKDNYRDAAALARAALQKGRPVWWNADPQGAAYYQLPTTDQPAETDKAWRVLNPSRELLSGVPVPEVIITSKPDLFDNQRALAAYIPQTGFEKVKSLSAFTVWQRRAK